MTFYPRTTMTPMPLTSDSFDLERFIKAQHPLYTTALMELQSGKKRTHWMWFLFPQAQGLGSSAMAQLYAIRSRAEAATYLKHPLLGLRLLESTEAVLKHTGKSAHEIFGSPDDLKFHSSMTLFLEFGGGGPFQQAIGLFYQGEKDQATLDILKSWK